MTFCLVVFAALAAADEFAPRIELLSTQLDRLQFITVPGALETERARRMDAARQALDRGAANTDEFNAIYHAIDEVRMWLWQNAADRPMPPDTSLSESKSGWTLSNGVLSLTIARDDLSMRVGTGTSEWRFLPCDKGDVIVNGKSTSLRSAGAVQVEEFNTGYSSGIVMTLANFPEAGGLELRLSANLIDNEVVFEIAASENGVVVESVNWPKGIDTSSYTDGCSVIPHMQGMLLPYGWPQTISEGNLCNSRALYMPWWGHLQGGPRTASPGVLVIIETADDGGAAYDHTPGGATLIRPRWYASLGKVGYLRTIRYVFDDKATYVTMAKRYRRYVKEQGRFVSLAEKLQRTPNLTEVIGRPVLHIGALYHFVKEASLFNKDRIEANHALSTFDDLAGRLREAKANGIEDAYVHLDGWGFYGYDNGHPDVLPPGAEQGGWEGLRRFADTCEELGYLFAVHDQYRDFYFNAVSFDDRLVAYRYDGSREEHSTWCGGPQTILSPRFAPGYVRRNHDLFAQHGIKVKGAYLDVFSVVPLEESSDRAHPVTRAECARYRAECFNLLRARGYVVSSEEPTDYLAPYLDLVHHGPYATYPRIGGGEARGIPVPLWNLVYHDSILLPWEMGEDGGWGVPKGDAGYLHCLLNAGLPYAGLSPGETELGRMREALALNRRCATLEMVNHEFMDDSYRHQRAAYSDGTVVTVNFEAKSFVVAAP